jgi:DNA-binding MarR family transcriptional regulator
MNPLPPKKAASGDDAARAAWLMMSDLVLDNSRRRQVSEALAMPFGRTRAIRRLARAPMSMSELAAALGIDPPNATTVVDELEAQKLVRRKAHPSDRRLKLVELTSKGRRMAQKANEILATPPPALIELDADDLKELRRVLAKLRTEN